MDKDVVCFRCRAVLNLEGEPKPVSETCAGCGGAAFGMFYVQKLNDIQRARCKKYFNMSTRELLEKSGIKTSDMPKP